MTERCSEDRASELSNHTGVPGKFVVAYEEFVEDCALAEKKIHLALNSHRVNRDREFFELKLKDAIRVIATIAREVNEATAPSAQSQKHRQAPVRHLQAPVRSRRGYPDRLFRVEETLHLLGMSVGFHQIYIVAERFNWLIGSRRSGRIWESILFEGL